MSKKFEVVQERLSGDDFRVYKSALVEGGVYIETRVTGGGDGFTFIVEELLQALHSQGFDVRGFEPRKTLNEQVEDLLTANLAMKQPERARQIIELVQGFKP